jgi:hypothetical protein
MLFKKKYSKFWLCIANLQSFHDAKEKPQLELCALLAIVFRTAKLTINVPVVYMGQYKVVLRGDYP